MRGLSRGRSAAPAWGSLLPALRFSCGIGGRHRTPPTEPGLFLPSGRTASVTTRWRGAPTRAAERGHRLCHAVAIAHDEPNFP